MPRIPPLDYEDLMSQYLRSCGVNAFPIPIPSDLGLDLPYSVIESVGGHRLNIAIDQPMISIDTYASSLVEAQRVSRDIVALIYDAPASCTQMQVQRIDSIAIPYSNPDPRHPTLERVSINATLSVRVRCV